MVRTAALTSRSRLSWGIGEFIFERREVTLELFHRFTSEVRSIPRHVDLAGYGIAIMI